MKVIVFVAHPDDEVLGMGGTILKHSQKGDFVKVTYLATGITSRRSTKLDYVKILKEIDSKRLSEISKKYLLLVDGEGVKRTGNKIFQTVN
jgi:LmbE family N-acetylglucosaminyl deacetylase